MSFLSWLKGIGEDLAGVGQSANDLYNKLSAEEQQAAQWASGALAIINQNITVEAKYLIPIIQSKFPNITLDTITSVLKEISTAITTIPPATLEDAIAAIQAYLLPKAGNAWIVAVQGLVNLAATILSPETPIQKFVAIGEFVFQDIITPLLGLHKSGVVPVIVNPAPIIGSPVISAPIAPTANVPLQTEPATSEAIDPNQPAT